MFLKACFNILHSMFSSTFILFNLCFCCRKQRRNRMTIQKFCHSVPPVSVSVWASTLLRFPFLSFFSFFWLKLRNIAYSRIFEHFGQKCAFSYSHATRGFIIIAAFLNPNALVCQVFYALFCIFSVGIMLCDILIFSPFLGFVLGVHLVSAVNWVEKRSGWKLVRRLVWRLWFVVP